MNNENMGEIIKILAEAYPKDYVNKNIENMRTRFKLFNRILGSYSYRAVEKVCLDYIASDEIGKAPPIGLIKARVDKLCEPQYRYELVERNGEKGTIRIEIPSEWLN